MRTAYKRFSVILGFGVLLAVLVVNTVVIRRQVAVQIQDHAWVAHTQDVLLQLARTESLLKDAETGQRGYLFTNDASYLAPYDRAVGQIDSEIRRLADLTADNPNQQARIAQLHALADQKLKELAATISLYRAGDSEAAEDMVLTNRGLQTMQRIRALMDQMEQEERSLDARRRETYRKSTQLTVACVYLTSALAGVGLVLLGYFVLRDLALREKHSVEIRQREEWFRVTLTSIGDGVIATDGQGRVTFINRVAEQLTGRTLREFKGKPVVEAFPIYNELTGTPTENPVQKVMQMGRIVGLANHTVLEQPNGTRLPIEDSAAPIQDDRGQLVGVVLVFRDATAERKAQDLLRKTEKIAAAARLAATVAHEINNPLEAVSNLIYLAKSHAGVPAEVIGELNLAEDELARASHVTRQTLGFYRESTFPDAVDMSALVESVLKLYSNKLKNKNIVVQRDFAPCPPLRGWTGELRQVVSNLVSNAIDAMSTGGTLRLGIGGAVIEEGDAVQLTVEDDGPGIASEHVDHIFEPFFTTKKDVGTGLGLWVSKQIVERHGGSIKVGAKNGPGAIFTVVLPCSTQASVATSA
jgi:PAS domain S-box-containing protein